MGLKGLNGDIRNLRIFYGTEGDFRYIREFKAIYGNLRGF